MLAFQIGKQYRELSLPQALRDLTNVVLVHDQVTFLGMSERNSCRYLSIACPNPSFGNALGSLNLRSQAALEPQNEPLAHVLNSSLFL